MALAEQLGEPNAGWYVIRLWCWAQRYAPTGKIPTKIVPQVEAAMGWKGEIGKLITCALSVGLFDAYEVGLEIHDWPEMQCALVEKSKRDAALKRKHRRTSGANSARAAKEPGANSAPLHDGRDGHYRTDTTNKQPAGEKPPAIHPLQDLWNQAAPPKAPKWLKTPPARLKSVLARCKEHPEPGFWPDLFARINASDFLSGRRVGFVATPDWVLNPTNLNKIIEGNYDNNDPPRPASKGPIDAASQKHTQTGFITDDGIIPLEQWPK